MLLQTSLVSEFAASINCLCCWSWGIWGFFLGMLWFRSELKPYICINGWLGMWGNCHFMEIVTVEQWLFLFLFFIYSFCKWGFWLSYQKEADCFYWSFFSVNNQEFSLISFLIYAKLWCYKQYLFLVDTLSGLFCCTTNSKMTIKGASSNLNVLDY